MINVDLIVGFVLGFSGIEVFPGASVMVYLVVESRPAYRVRV